MTTYTEPVPATSRRPLAAVLGAGTAFVLTAIGTFKDGSGLAGVDRVRRDLRGRPARDGAGLLVRRSDGERLQCRGSAA